jgi:uncharacterized RDD family membrane protein YckC
VQPWSAAGGVVTPEAVRLDFEAAGIGSRGIAIIIDLLVQGAGVMALAFALGLVGATGVTDGLPPWIATTIVLVLVFAIFWGYPTALETLWRGRTLGKAAMGLRVVTVEGAPVRFRHAAIRAALALVDLYVSSGGVAVVSALVTRRHQRLGDLAAGTIVVRERTGSAPPRPVWFRVPPGAEAYAATVDPSGLRPADYQAVRSFLMRAPSLRPDVRAEVAASIATPLATRLRHVPPAWVSAEMFLACLAARYQQRGGPTPSV